MFDIVSYNFEHCLSAGKVLSHIKILIIYYICADVQSFWYLNLGESS